jgi:hypothetical protein
VLVPIYNDRAYHFGRKDHVFVTKAVVKTGEYYITTADSLYFRHVRNALNLISENLDFRNSIIRSS